jgi:hypothetical protein
MEVFERLELKLLHFAAVYRARVHQKSNPGIVHMQVFFLDMLCDGNFSILVSQGTICSHFVNINQ